MTTPYYILEHPKRGVLRDLEKTDSGHVGQFSSTGNRGGDKCARFATALDALLARERLPESVAQSTEIRCSADHGTYLGPWPVVSEWNTKDTFKPHDRVRVLSSCAYKDEVGTVTHKVRGANNIYAVRFPNESTRTFAAYELERVQDELPTQAQAVYEGKLEITFVGNAPSVFNRGAPEITDLWDQIVTSAKVTLAAAGYQVAHTGYGSRRVDKEQA